MKKCTPCKGPYVATFGPHPKEHGRSHLHPMWPPSARTPKSRGELIYSICGPLGPHPAPQRERVISLGPCRWPPAALTTKSRGAVICSLCCQLGPRGSPNPFTPIGLTAVLWGVDASKRGIPLLGRQRPLFRKQLDRLKNPGSSGSAASAPFLVRGQMGK